MNDRRNTPTINGNRNQLWIRLSIWSLKRHNDLIAVLRMVMMAFSYVVLLAVFAGRLDLETALRVIAFGGLSAVVLITGLVLTRRNVLLGIEDPVLKAEAHQAMLALIRSRVPVHSEGWAQNDQEVRSDAAGCGQTGECNR